MDALTAVILACSVYVDDALVRALIEVSSHGNRYAVVDPGVSSMDEPTATPPDNVEGAVRQARELRRAGRRPLLGLMPVPAEWAGLFGRPTSELFEPCTSVSIATAMMSRFERECAGSSERGRERGKRARTVAGLDRTRACVVQRYGEAVGISALPEIVTLELSLERRRPLGRDGPPEDPDRILLDTRPSDARPWGADRILLEAATSTAG